MPDEDWIRRRVRTSESFDPVSVPIANQTHKQGRAINDQQEQAHYIASQHADVQRFWLCEGGILTAKSRFGSIVTSQSDLRTDHHRLGDTANAAQAGRVLARGKAESDEIICAKRSAISACVDKEPGGDPGSARGADLPAHYWPDDSIVASLPNSG